jgi:hypothetical protein
MIGRTKGVVADPPQGEPPNHRLKLAARAADECSAAAKRVFDGRVA